MSSTVVCRMSDGALIENLRPTKKDAEQVLVNILDKHRARGNQVIEQLIAEQSLLYVVKDASGVLVSTYQIVD